MPIGRSSLYYGHNIETSYRKPNLYSSVSGKSGLRELLAGWRSFELKPVEIRHNHTGEPFKRVWRGVVRR
jgi:hypothetical protein